jgi:hypothetical protein
MNAVASTIDPRRLEFAVGATGVVFYLGCVLTMAKVSHDGSVASLNALAHGIEDECTVAGNQGNSCSDCEQRPTHLLGGTAH